MKGLVAPLGLTNFTVAPGETITADVVIQNKGIAHSHVPEQRDFYESWVEFDVKDPSGKTCIRADSSSRTVISTSAPTALPIGWST